MYCTRQKWFEEKFQGPDSRFSETLFTGDFTFHITNNIHAKIQRNHTIPPVNKVTSVHIPVASNSDDNFGNVQLCGKTFYQKFG